MTTVPDEELIARDPGACFDLLPQAYEDLPAPRLSQQPEPEQDERKTILLVEDQEAIRKLIRFFFEKKGFRLISAENGCEALTLAEMYEGKIDVLISDVLMPKMDGPTLAVKMNQIRPGMKILFISGHPGHSIEALRNFTIRSEFLQKPFKMPALFHKIEALMAQ